MIHYNREYLKDAMEETTLNALTKERLGSHFVYISPALLVMCCATADAVYDSRKTQPLLGGIPLPRASNNPRKDTWRSLELDGLCTILKEHDLETRPSFLQEFRFMTFIQERSLLLVNGNQKGIHSRMAQSFSRLMRMRLHQNQENQRGRYTRPVIRRKLL
jgi:hypothetical protein